MVSFVDLAGPFAYCNSSTPPARRFSLINYDPKDWPRILCAIRGTVVLHVLLRVGLLMLITALMCRFEESLSRDNFLLKSFNTSGHALIGVAIGLLIVFRNNSSYDRFWEGRKLWGNLINTCRNLMRGFAVTVGSTPQLVGLLTAYPLALKQHLRNLQNMAEIEGLVGPEIYKRIADGPNTPSLLMLEVSRLIFDAMREGKIDPVTAQGLEVQVRVLLDCQGGCERILKTPIPFVYAAHIKQLLFLYLFTLPFTLVTQMHWAAVPAVGIIAFGLLGIEEAGVEIEDPFGDDPNDLPTEAMCETVGKDMASLGK